MGVTNAPGRGGCQFRNNVRYRFARMYNEPGWPRLPEGHQTEGSFVSPFLRGHFSILGAIFSAPLCRGDVAASASGALSRSRARRCGSVKVPINRTAVAGRLGTLSVPSAPTGLNGLNSTNPFVELSPVVVS